MKLQQFDILFYKGSSWISRLIKAETSSEYSHVALVIDPLHVVETDWRYPLRINHINYKSSDFDIYRVDLSIMEREKMLEFIYMSLNVKYDYDEILKIFLNNKLKLNLRDDDNFYTCASWIYSVFLSAGKNLVPMSSDIVSPQALIRGGIITKVDTFL
jgi:hypothetical protein